MDRAISHAASTPDEKIEKASQPGEAVAAALAAVVCTHNRYDVLPDALASLERQSIAAGQLQVLVIDNSTDTERRKTFWENHELPHNFRLIVDDVPGLSRARNTGLREADAPIVAYMDDDAFAGRDWCAGIVDAFAQLADAGIVGGPVEAIWPQSQPSWLHEFQRSFLTVIDLGPERRRLKENEWLAGTNIAFRRDALLKAGGFNEALGRTRNLLLSNEELAVTPKIHDQGLHSYYDPAIKVSHRVHANRVRQAWLRRRVCWQGVSDLIAGAQKCDPEEHWSKVGKYMSALPVESRGVRGLLLDTPDPELFFLQCQALESLMHLLLDHGEDPFPDNAGDRAELRA